jgi:phosphatidylinositol glycan class B
MEYLEFFPQFRAHILGFMPRVLQSIFAGIGDFYTWRLAEKMYGVGSTSAWTTVSRF